MKRKFLNALAMCFMAFGALMLVASVPVGAMGGGSSSSSSSKSCKKGKRWCVKKNRCVKSTCKRGQVYSSSRCKCVKRRSELNDEDLYVEAVRLVDADQYKEALVFLKLIKNQKQARVLNYIGYSTRKLGRIDEGLVYYHKALKLDPEYTLVREYLGEALLLKGDLAGARVQLAEIAKRCDPATCHEYEELSEEIAKYIARQN